MLIFFSAGVIKSSFRRLLSRFSSGAAIQQPGPMLLYQRLRNEPAVEFVCSHCRNQFSATDPAEALKMFAAHTCYRAAGAASLSGTEAAGK